MARPLKQGVDYFPLNVYDDDKLKFIRIKYNVAGVGIVFELYRRIYSLGFWCEWSDDVALLFSDEIKADYQLVLDVVSECLKREVFSNSKYEEHSILTSKGIQDRYSEICKRRKDLKAVDNYLVNDSLMYAKSIHSVDINRVNVNINEVNVNTMHTEVHKEKKRKEKLNKTKEEDNTTPKSPKGKVVFEELLSVCNFSEKMNEALRDYEENIRGLGKGYKKSDKAWKLFLNKTAKFIKDYGEAVAIDCVNESTINGWKSLFAPKGKPQQSGKSNLEKQRETQYTKSQEEMDETIKDLMLN